MEGNDKGKDNLGRAKKLFLGENVAIWRYLA